jgi:hypothetical protein
MSSARIRTTLKIKSEPSVKVGSFYGGLDKNRRIYSGLPAGSWIFLLLGG